MSIDVHVRLAPYLDALEFYAMRRGSAGREILLPGTLDVWRPVSSGAEPAEPSFRIERELWIAMVREAEGMIEPTAASERHLADAIAVRDRMMTLLERELAVAALDRRPPTEEPR